MLPSSCIVGAVNHLFDVEQRPLVRHVFPDGPQQERVVDIVEQTLDVKF
jgi:hypothetical protein